MFARVKHLFGVNLGLRKLFEAPHHSRPGGGNSGRNPGGQPAEQNCAA